MGERFLSEEKNLRIWAENKKGDMTDVSESEWTNQRRAPRLYEQAQFH